jgi:hypothetical protein
MGKEVASKKKFHIFIDSCVCGRKTRESMASLITKLNAGGCRDVRYIKKHCRQSRKYVVVEIKREEGFLGWREILSDYGCCAA